MANEYGAQMGDPHDKRLGLIEASLNTNAIKLMTLTTPYPGTGTSPAELSGVQTANTGTYGSTEAGMLQTLWDMARAMGLLA